MYACIYSRLSKKVLPKHYKTNFIGYFGNKGMSYDTERYNLAILIGFSANKTQRKNFTTENEGCMPAHILVLAKKKITSKTV